MAAKCPHDCPRCKANEAGLDARPLTPAEFMLLGLVVNEPKPRERSLELIDAESARDEAQAAFDLALAVWGKLVQTKADDDLVAEAKRACDKAGRVAVEARANAQGIARREDLERLRREYVAGLPVPVD